MSIIWRKNFL